ncbi:hypothetical protein PoB_002164200 [Plakobranchus ocellatus]|uniref:Uncharacterized protein n=1 Tax=Plakobranchus ocellatus TaxID=259542 RepID=A0AAV3ZKT3_9GAST|nr:hypothetical protein PoB_002164200 [Plakobranchus ocellatus]
MRDMALYTVLGLEVGGREGMRHKEEKVGVHCRLVLKGGKAFVTMEGSEGKAGAETVEETVMIKSLVVQIRRVQIRITKKLWRNN